MAVQRLLDPTPALSLDDHRAAGGLQALDDARKVEREAVIATVADSGLRGRGGAGFPTGQKWATVAANAAGSALAPTVVVNEQVVGSGRIVPAEQLVTLIKTLLGG